MDVLELLIPVLAALANAKNTVPPPEPPVLPPVEPPPVPWDCKRKPTLYLSLQASQPTDLVFYWESSKTPRTRHQWVYEFGDCEQRGKFWKCPMYLIPNDGYHYWVWYAEGRKVFDPVCFINKWS